MSIVRDENIQYMKLKRMLPRHVWFEQKFKSFPFIYCYVNFRQYLYHIYLNA